jgi:tetratricopeptide (TPR) repeat protein
MEYAAGNPSLAASYRTHALDYMMYATLQLARDREARAIADEVAAIPAIATEHLGRAFALAAIPARYALERHRWDEAARLTPRPADYPWDRFPQAEAITHFARAVGAARSGDVATARGAAERLATLRDTLAATGQGYWADQVEIQRRLAAAVVARAEALTERALAAARSAAELEATTEKHVVTPGPIVPARELLGELYLEAGQPRQALHEFETALVTEPNRFWSLHGAARAAARAGEQARARDYYTKLVALCAPCDTDRPAIAEARAFLAEN